MTSRAAKNQLILLSSFDVKYCNNSLQTLDLTGGRKIFAVFNNISYLSLFANKLATRNADVVTLIRFAVSAAVPLSISRNFSGKMDED